MEHIVLENTGYCVERGEQGVLYRTHSTGEHGVLCGALTTYCGEQGVLCGTHSTGEHGVLCGALTTVENKEYCVEHIVLENTGYCVER